MFDRLYRMLTNNTPEVQTDTRTPLQISLSDGSNIADKTVTSEDVAAHARSSLADREMTRVQLRGDFSADKVDISGLQFQDSVDLSDSSFKGQSLGDTQFDRHQYLDTAFVRAVNTDFSNADIRIAQKPPAEFQNIYVKPDFFNFSGSNFTNASISVDIERHKLDNANFSDARFGENSKITDSSLTDANFSGASGAGIDLSNNQMERANFAQSSFNGINLQGSNLKDADFTEANLEGADFRGADLSGATFQGANIKNAKFDNANLENVDFRGAETDGISLGSRPELPPSLLIKLSKYGVDPATAHTSSSEQIIHTLSQKEFVGAGTAEWIKDLKNQTGTAAKTNHFTDMTLSTIPGLEDYGYGQKVRDWKKAKAVEPETPKAPPRQTLVARWEPG